MQVDTCPLCGGAPHECTCSKCKNKTSALWDYAAILGVSIAMFLLAAATLGLTCGVFVRAYDFVVGGP